MEEKIREKTIREKEIIENDIKELGSIVKAVNDFRYETANALSNLKIAKTLCEIRDILQERFHEE